MLVRLEPSKNGTKSEHNSFSQQLLAPAPGFGNAVFANKIHPPSTA